MTAGDDFSFREHCVIRDLEDLAQESGPLDAHSAGDSTVKSVQLKSISDFYPVNPALLIWQNSKKPLNKT